MQSTRWAGTIYCSISLSVAGCGATDRAPTEAISPAPGVAGASPSAEPVEVVQVETITTVQSSLGSFLSPNPERLVPAYVERSPESASADAVLAGNWGSDNATMTFADDQPIE